APCRRRLRPALRRPLLRSHRSGSGWFACPGSHQIACQRCEKRKLDRFDHIDLAARATGESSDRHRGDSCRLLPYHPPMAKRAKAVRLVAADQEPPDPPKGISEQARRSAGGRWVAIEDDRITCGRKKLGKLPARCLGWDLDDTRIVAALETDPHGSLVEIS